MSPSSNNDLQLLSNQMSTMANSLESLTATMDAVGKGMSGLTAVMEGKKGKSSGESKGNGGGGLGGAVGGLLASLKGPLSGVFAGLKGVAKQLLGTAFGPLGLIVSTLVEVLLPAVTIISEAFDSLLSPIIKTLSLVVAVLLVPMQALTSLLNAIFAPFRQFIDSIQTAVNRFVILLGLLGKTPKSLENVASDLNKLGTQIMGNIAETIKNPLALFDIAQKIAAIVQKFNPAVVEQFNLVISDIISIFGRALTPVLQIITLMLRQFADYLVLIIDDAMPRFMQVIQKISLMIMGNLPAILDLIESKLNEFITSLESMLWWNGVFETTMGYLATAGKVLLSVWVLMKMGMDGFVHMLRWAAAKIEDFFSITGGRADKVNEEFKLIVQAGKDEMNDIWKPKEKVKEREKGVTTNLSAATGTSFVGAADIGREAMKNAFQASSAPTAEQLAMNNANKGWAQVGGFIANFGPWMAMLKPVNPPAFQGQPPPP